MTILVTGGAGFIGCNFIHNWFAHRDEPIVTLDALTYAGNVHNLAGLIGAPKHHFVHGKIEDRALVAALLAEHRPRAIVHFAAETHVDRSINRPDPFIESNVVGTFALLEETRRYWASLSGPAVDVFRFLHVSTDEVYGALGPADPAISETAAYRPNSPYAASKAASDHLVRAWHATFGLPLITTHCSNNYGPYQYPEKLIPLAIRSALRSEPLPVYGDGRQVRDWLFVADHCEAIKHVLERGHVGEIYNIGARNQVANITLVRMLCGILDELEPAPQRYAEFIHFVADRPGHDRRYALDPRKIETELEWRPRETLESGLRKTVTWYLANREWIEKAIG